MTTTSRRLGLAELPVLAAPMAGGPSTPALVAAAASAGSFGFVPGGYRTAGQLAAEIAGLRGLTGGAFGVNLFVPEHAPVERRRVLDYRDRIAPEAERLGVELGEPRWEDDDDWPAKIALLAEDPVPWVSFTFGLPGRDAVHRLRKAGSRLLVTVTDPSEARAAAELAPDGLVVQSSAAGGHRGTFDQYRTPGEEPLPELVARVVAATALPVIAAGGIVRPDQVVDALAAGAEAVQVGTALLLADEAATRPAHRAALTDPTFALTTPMRAFTGRVARGLRNRFSERYDAAAPVGYPAVHHITAPMRAWAAAHDDPHLLHLWAGTGHRAVSARPAAETLTALVP